MLHETKDIFLNRSYQRLEDSFTPIVIEALHNDKVNEIMLNCDGKLFIEYKDKGIEECGTFNSADAYSLIKTIASIAHINIDEKAPFLSCEIPKHGSRLEALLPPLVKAPVFSIRVLLKKDTYNLDKLVEKAMLTKNEALFLQKCIKDKKNILVSGQTGSGKTTLVNALLNEIAVLCASDRIISIEDTSELEIPSSNKVKLFTNEHNDMAKLVKSSLRLRPDRIIVGEIRGMEALDLIDALSTGHSGGLSTIHAGTDIQALNRLGLLVKRNTSAPSNYEKIIASTIDIILQLKKTPIRHISSITHVKNFKDNSYIVEKINADFEDLYAS